MPVNRQTELKLYYTIGEVAEMFEVNVSLIRYYEKEFEVIKPHKNKKGNRLFTQSDVDYFRRIFELTRDGGRSLAEAKTEIKKKGVVEISKVQVPQQDPNDLINRLKSVREKLERLLRQYDQ